MLLTVNEKAAHHMFAEWDRNFKRVYLVSFNGNRSTRPMGMVVLTIRRRG